MNNDDLMPAFDQWKRNQLPVEDLKVIYESLCTQKKIPLRFPVPDISRHDITSDIKLTPEVLLSILKDILPNEVIKSLTIDDGNHLADEISSSIDRGVSFDDFVRLFQTKSV